jgi:hypothetical protein
MVMVIKSWRLSTGNEEIPPLPAGRASAALSWFGNLNMRKPCHTSHASKAVLRIHDEFHRCLSTCSCGCCCCCLLQVEGAGLRTVQLSLPQLQEQFKKAEVAATVQCTGNRRSEMKAVPAPGGTGHEIKGLDWAAGAIGTAVWGGVKLRDVLLAAGGWDMWPPCGHQSFKEAMTSQLLFGRAMHCLQYDGSR